MSHFMGVGIFRIGLNRPDLGCWRLTLKLGKTIARNLIYFHWKCTMLFNALVVHIIRETLQRENEPL